MQISDLPTVTKKPALYAKGNAEMWQDDHISRHLLALHLDSGSDAASRKASTIQKTVQWISTLLGPGKKRILDLGCGPGLYCEQLAVPGHDVTGVDFSRRSIEYARNSAQEKGLGIRYIPLDYRHLSFENAFDLAMMIYCDFDVLIPPDRSCVLEGVFRALKPGGIFVFDTLNPEAPAAMKVPGRSWDTTEDGFWKGVPYLALSETFHYEKEQVILQQHTICSDREPPSVYRFWTHYYNAGQLGGILGQAGFARSSFHDGILPDDGSGMQDMVTFCVAQKG